MRTDRIKSPQRTNSGRFVVVRSARAVTGKVTPESVAAPLRLEKKRSKTKRISKGTRRYCLINQLRGSYVLDVALHSRGVMVESGIR